MKSIAIVIQIRGNACILAIQKNKHTKKPWIRSVGSKVPTDRWFADLFLGDLAILL